jgi:hypothetical protein
MSYISELLSKFYELSPELQRLILEIGEGVAMGHADDDRASRERFLKSEGDDVYAELTEEGGAGRDFYDVLESVAYMGAPDAKKMVAYMADFISGEDD